MIKEEKLIAYLNNNFEELKWRRETEYKLLSSLVLVFPVIFIGYTAIVTGLKNNIATLWLGVSMILGIIGMTIFVTYKINAEHKIYKKIASININICEKLDFFNANSDCHILNEEYRKLGTGKGHIKTIGILWSISLSISIAIITIIINEFFSFSIQIKQIYYIDINNIIANIGQIIAFIGTILVGFVAQGGIPKRGDIIMAPNKNITYLGWIFISSGLLISLLLSIIS